MDIFATMTKRLEDRTNAFKEHLERAADARQEEIDVQRAEAQARAEASGAALDAKLDGGRAELTTALSRAMDRIRARSTGGAEADAVDAEDYAGYVFDFALACLDEAEVAALTASYARDRAYVMRREGGSRATPAGVVADPAAPHASGIGDKVAGVFDQVVGSAKHDLGKATGSTRLETEGAAQEAKGHVEWAVGKEPPRTA